MGRQGKRRYAYAEYKQRELNEKGEKTGKVLGKLVINLYSTGIFSMGENKGC